MRRNRLAVVLSLCQFGQGCHSDFLNLGLFADPEKSVRVEIETDDQERNLPCRVVFWPDEKTRNVLWRAQFEEGFCDRKAEETRNVLNAKGWACSTQPLDGKYAERIYVTASWRCIKQQQLATNKTENGPPIPQARPKQRGETRDFFDDPKLEAAVRSDLSSTIQKVAGQSTLSAVSRGDIDGNGLNDAIVVLTNRNNQGRKNHLVMAYLGDGEAYNLTDIHVTPGNRTGPNDDLIVAIDEGLIELSICCAPEFRPILLAFRDRELVVSR